MTAVILFNKQATIHVKLNESNYFTDNMLGDGHYMVHVADDAKFDVLRLTETQRQIY